MCFVCIGRLCRIRFRVCHIHLIVLLKPRCALKVTWSLPQNFPLFFLLTRVENPPCSSFSPYFPLPLLTPPSFGCRPLLLCALFSSSLVSTPPSSFPSLFFPISHIPQGTLPLLRFLFVLGMYIMCLHVDLLVYTHK